MTSSSCGSSRFEDERLDVRARLVAFHFYVFCVEVGNAHRHIHAEFADAVERLFSAEAVFVAGRELAVVVQLNGAECFVLRELIAISYFNEEARCRKVWVIRLSQRETLPDPQTLRSLLRQSARRRRHSKYLPSGTARGI